MDAPSQCRMKVPGESLYVLEEASVEGLMAYIVSEVDWADLATAKRVPRVLDYLALTIASGGRPQVVYHESLLGKKLMASEIDFQSLLGFKVQGFRMSAST
jgi:hypothetical protein